ncbi:MAG: hypothetical protein EA398_13265 [Deltaproteobacteria bacterium]|nr:MAG: hypothetical protein EA398_13265 [Deltaproteobacteria bacterium]
MIAVLALSLVVTAQAHATTMLYANVERLTEISTLVVEGEVVGQRTWQVDEGGIFTEWTLSVSEVLKGDASTTVRFRQWGGQIGDVSTYIPGDARFEVGERVMVFLHNDDEGVFWPSALGQSKFVIGSGPGPVGPEVPLEEAVERGMDLDPTRMRRIDIPRLDGMELPELASRDLRSLSFYDDRRAGEPVYHIHRVEVMRHAELVERVREAVRLEQPAR